MRKKINQTGAGCSEGRGTTPKSFRNKYDYCFLQNVENNDKDKGRRGGIGGNKRLLPSFAINQPTIFCSECNCFLGKQIFHFCARKVAPEEGQGECAETHKNLA